MDPAVGMVSEIARRSRLGLSMGRGHREGVKYM